MEFKPFEDFEDCCSANAEALAKQLIENIRIKDYKNATLTKDDVNLIASSSLFITKNMLHMFYEWLQLKSGEHIRIVSSENQK